MRERNPFRSTEPRACEFTQTIKIRLSKGSPLCKPDRLKTKDMDRRFNDHHLNDCKYHGMPLSQKVDRYTRAGKYGKAIICPKCKNMEIVYHFAWSSIVCQECRKVINKYDYYVVSDVNGSVDIFDGFFDSENEK
jgi:ribosomal protein S27E